MKGKTGLEKGKKTELHERKNTLKKRREKKIGKYVKGRLKED